MWSCDHLPLCSSVTLQASAADHEIMKSQTHCAFYAVWRHSFVLFLNQCFLFYQSRMLIYSSHCEHTIITDHSKQHCYPNQPLETLHNVSLIALYSVWPCLESISKTQQRMNKLGVEPQSCIQTLTVICGSQSDQWLLVAVLREVRLCLNSRLQCVYCGTPLPVLLTTYPSLQTQAKTRENSG